MTLNSTSVSKIFNNEAFINNFANLAFRWQDEREYENINDYAAPLEAGINKILKTSDFTGALKMTKRPFGFKIVGPFTFKNGTTINNATVAFKCTADGSISWSAKATA